MTAKKVRQVLLSGAILLFCSGIISAQVLNTNVDRSNLQIFMNDLQTTYGPSLGIPYQTIESHLLSTLRNVDPKANCDIPNATVIENDDQIIKFKWAPIAGAQSYRINYINTDSGQQGAFPLLPSSDSTYTIPFTQTGKIIFGIQSVCATPNTSGIHIIIQDEVAGTVTFEDDIPCACEAYDMTMELGNSWPPLQPGMSFDLRVVNPGSPVNLSTIHAEVLEAEIQFNISCPGQFLPELENNMLYFYENSTYKGYFSFEPSYYFIEGQVVLLSFCKDQDGGGAGSQSGNTKSSNPKSNQPAIFPNPADDFIIVRDANSTDGEVAMKIFNASGRVAGISEIVVNQDSGDPVINISGLSPGWYFLQFIQKGKSHSIPFYKK
jgi:hypothetical protein